MKKRVSDLFNNRLLLAAVLLDIIHMDVLSKPDVKRARGIVHELVQKLQGLKENEDARMQH